MPRIIFLMAQEIYRHIIVCDSQLAYYKEQELWAFPCPPYLYLALTWIGESNLLPFLEFAKPDQDYGIIASINTTPSFLYP